MTQPPVGIVCPHSNIVPVSMQIREYRLDDNSLWIYYHGWIQNGKLSSEVCGKPELWRWRYYLRRCEECGQRISNPWVPVCSTCWASSQSYPSWNHVIRLDMRLGVD